MSAALSWTWLGVEVVRPEGLLALLLPLAVLVWSLRSEPHRDEATGSFRLWRELAAETRATDARRRRGLPPGIVWLLLALVAASLALAGPRRSRRDLAETWEVVIDRSASMYLPLEAGAGEPRLVAAMRQAESLLAQRGVELEDCTFVDASSGARQPFEVAAAWLREPPPQSVEPRWARYDGPGRLLVTDRSPADLEHASWVAVGGAEIPGLVDRRLEWDGSELEEVVETRAPRVAASGLPAELEELVRIWCDTRGLELGEGTGGAASLFLQAEPPGTPTPRRVGRDGWWIEGAWHAPRPVADERVSWLPGGEVLAAPGRLRIGLSGPLVLGGDVAALAASWCELFDRSLASPPGVVPLAERRAAGAASERLAGLPRSGSALSHEQPLEAWLLLLASAFAGLWILRGRRSANAASLPAVSSR